MNLLIPIVSGLLFWAGGRDQWNVPFNQKLFRRIGVGLTISILAWNWWAVFTYAIACFSLHYGEKYQLKFGKIVWLTSGFLFGVASLDLWNGLYCALILYGLLWLSNTGIDRYEWKLSHQWVEWIFGTIGTVIWIYK